MELFENGKEIAKTNKYIKIKTLNYIREMVSKNWQTDEREFNHRGGPSLFHKVRVIVGTKLTPIAFGITLPTEIAQQFSGCQLMIHVSGTAIIMESGVRV